jgi:hypothetical protein
MPARDQEDYRVGQYLVGGAYPVYTAHEMRKAAIRPGMFMVGGEFPGTLAKAVRLVQEAPEASGGHIPAPGTISPVLKPESPSYTGCGARLKRELAQLMLDRGVQPEQHRPLPLCPPSTTPILIKGIATRIEIDGSCTMMMPGALVWDPNDLPRLLYKHHPDQIAGEITRLGYVGGELMIEARVEHAEAKRMPAFSVGLTPHDFEIVDHGGRFFHVRLTKGLLTEVSLTDLPALRSARVTARAPIAIVSKNPTYRSIGLEMARIRMALAA